MDADPTHLDMLIGLATATDRTVDHPKVSTHVAGEISLVVAAQEVV